MQQNMLGPYDCYFPTHGKLCCVPLYDPRDLPLPPTVKVELLNRSLWEMFNQHTTEMIITKHGRRMFPPVEINVTGLEKQNNYYIFMRLEPASDYRQKYVKNSDQFYKTVLKFGNTDSKGSWRPTTLSEEQPHVNYRMVLHPDSPAKGSHWMKKPISFNKVKITNDATKSLENQILLISMHKYVVCISIVMYLDTPKYMNNYYNNINVNKRSCIIALKETEFIAVTAYQNESIINLKIDNNPFAKGFRREGQSRSKKKDSKEQDNTSQNEDESADEMLDGNEELEVSNEVSHTHKHIHNNEVSIDLPNTNRNENLPTLECKQNTNILKKNVQSTEIFRPWIKP